MYPQGRSVHVPTGNPTPRADPGPAGGVSMANKYSRAWRWMPKYNGSYRCAYRYAYSKLCLHVLNFNNIFDAL